MPMLISEQLHRGKVAENFVAYQKKHFVVQIQMRNHFADSPRKT